MENIVVTIKSVLLDNLPITHVLQGNTSMVLQVKCENNHRKTKKIYLGECRIDHPDCNPCYGKDKVSVGIQDNRNMEKDHCKYYAYCEDGMVNVKYCRRGTFFDPDSGKCGDAKRKSIDCKGTEICEEVHGRVIRNFKFCGDFSEDGGKTLTSMVWNGGKSNSTYSKVYFLITLRLLKLILISETCVAQKSIPCGSKCALPPDQCPAATTTKTTGNLATTDLNQDISDTSTIGKTWTKENYKTADPNCNNYCSMKNMRCSFINLKPLVYGCKTKLMRKTSFRGKTWTIKNYKTANPSCGEYCSTRGKICSLVEFRPKILYGCK